MLLNNDFWNFFKYRKGTYYCQSKMKEAICKTLFEAILKLEFLHLQNFSLITMNAESIFQKYTPFFEGHLAVSPLLYSKNTIFDIDIHGLETWLSS